MKAFIELPIIPILVVSILVAACDHARSSALTWDVGGSEANCSSAGSWSTGNAPVTTGETLVFDGPVNTDTINDFERTGNSAGIGKSSNEVSTPVPNLNSIVAAAPVIWPGQQTTIKWSIPNASSLDLNDGNGTQNYPASGSIVVTPECTTTYTFTARNAHGQSEKVLTVAVIPKPSARDALWQWSVPLTGVVSPETKENPRAFLYIPPNVSKVRGVIIGQHNMLEEPVLEHIAVRKGLADAGMAAIWVSPAFDGNFNFTANPNTPVIFQQMMDALAIESGYTELGKTPVVWIGHSAMAEAPYFFAAWDSQNAAATGAPKRCAASISLKGWYPGKHDSTTPTYSNSDLSGVPLLYIEGEYADANGRAGRALNFRNSTAGSIVTFFADVGGGHFDWNDNICESIGMYLRKIGQFRLPASAAADGTATLQTINPATQGYLADRWRKGQNPTADPAGVGSYTGNAGDAFWFFDKEHAEFAQNRCLPVKTSYQLLGYTLNGTLAAQSETHQQVNLSFNPDPAGDGLTFKLGSSFLDSVPAVSSRLTGWTGLPVGSPIGHSNNGPILINRICGPVDQLSPDTFRVRFDRIGTDNVFGQTRSRDIWLAATHPGDATYVRAVQQALLRIPLPLTGGSPQMISFPAIADQSILTASIPLSATTTGTSVHAGSTVDFYVREGPAKVNGNTLEFTQVPPRTKFPVKVTVVATQYGRNIAPLLQTAKPVVRTFSIKASLLEQWRLRHFGTATSAGEASDTADPDHDGRSNLLEYGSGTDPLVGDGSTSQNSGNDEDGTCLAITFDRIADPDITYIAEASSTLSQENWSSIWSSSGAANASGSVTVTDTELISLHPNRFLRLRMES